MKIDILAIGRLKDEAEKDIVDRYLKRFDAMGRAKGLGPCRVTDFAESRAADAEARKAQEADRLMQAAAGSHRIVLDVSGRTMSSEAFAQHLSELADRGTKACAFLIGGPDGHGAEILTQAGLRLSLGAMTLPHGLARVVLAEQLYRAATILAGHPYHRS